MGTNATGKCGVPWTPARPDNFIDILQACVVTRRYKSRALVTWHVRVRAIHVACIANKTMPILAYHRIHR